MQKKYFLGIISAIFLLNGCNLSPMYQKNNENLMLEQTQKIKIADIENYNGFKLHELLENKLNPYKKTFNEYILTVKLTQTEIGDQMIQEDDLSSRSKLILKADYVLKDKAGKVLLTASNNVSGTYNILADGYATYMTKQKIETDLITMLAEMIQLRIMSYYKQEAKNAG